MVSALWKACTDGDRESVDQLLAEHDVDIEIKDHAGVTPLIQAIKGGHLDIVKALLVKGADPANASVQGRPESYTTDPAILHELAAARGDLVPYPDQSQYYAAYPPYAYPGYAEQWYPPPQPQPSQESGDNQGQNSSPSANLPPPEVARSIPCRYYPACRYGASCMFYHPPFPTGYYPMLSPSAYPPPPPQNPSTSPTSSHSHPLPPNSYDSASVVGTPAGYYYPAPYPLPPNISPTHMRSHSEILPSPGGVPPTTSPTATIPSAGPGTPGTAVPPAVASATSPAAANPPNSFSPPQLHIPVPVPLMAYMPGPAPGGPMSPTAVYPTMQHLQHPHAHPHAHMSQPPPHQPPLMYGPPHPPPPPPHHMSQMHPSMHMQLQPGMEGPAGGGMDNMNMNVNAGMSRMRRGSVKDGNGNHGHHGHGGGRYHQTNGNGHHPHHGGHHGERGNGGGRNKPPCLFFPSGRCRNGDDCRFPHVLSPIGGENDNVQQEGGMDNGGKPGGHGYGNRFGSRGRGFYRDRERNGGAHPSGEGERVEGKTAGTKAPDAVNGNANSNGNASGGNSRPGSKHSRHSQGQSQSHTPSHGASAQRIPNAEDFPSLTNGVPASVSLTYSQSQPMTQQPQLNGWANAVNGNKPTAARALRDGSSGGSPKAPPKEPSASKTAGGGSTINPTAASIVAGTATPNADSPGKGSTPEVRVAA